MTIFRAVLVLVSWVAGAVATGFALFGGPDDLALGFGGVAVVSALTAWGLTLKTEADMERFKAGREDVWARRFEEAKWRDDYWAGMRTTDDLLQLPERFDAG